MRHAAVTLASSLHKLQILCITAVYKYDVFWAYDIYAYCIIVIYCTYVQFYMDIIIKNYV